MLEVRDPGAGQRLRVGAHDQAEGAVDLQEPGVVVTGPHGPQRDPDRCVLEGVAEALLAGAEGDHHLLAQLLGVAPLGDVTGDDQAQRLSLGALDRDRVDLEQGPVDRGEVAVHRPRQPGPHEGAQRVGVDHVLRIARSPPDHGVLGDVVLLEPLAAGREPGEPGIEHAHDGVGEVADEQPVDGLLGVQLGVRPAYVGHVGRDADVAGQLVAAGADAGDGQGDREAAAVSPYVGPVPGLLLAAGGGLDEDLEAGLDAELGGAGGDLVGIVEYGGCQVPDHLLLRPAEHRLGAGVEHRDQAVEVGGDHRVAGGGREQALEPGLGRLQRHDPGLRGGSLADQRVGDRPHEAGQRDHQDRPTPVAGRVVRRADQEDRGHQDHADRDDGGPDLAQGAVQGEPEHRQAEDRGEARGGRTVGVAPETDDQQEQEGGGRGDRGRAG